MNTHAVERVVATTTAPVITPATDALETVINTHGTERHFTAEVTANTKSLKECVLSAMKNYFTHVEGTTPADVYTMVLAQVEPPVLQATMEFTRGNQSKAAVLLGLSRGTLRKKLKQYGME